MEIRSWFSRVFGNEKNTKEPETSTEFTIYDGNKAIFTSYKNDFQNSADVRACVDAIARNAAKMHPKHLRTFADKTEYLQDSLYKIISKQPNEIQNAYKFYYQVVSELELYNNSFVYIQKDKDLKVTGLYPINFQTCKLYEFKEELWLKFRFGSGKERFVPYNDCIHLTRFTSNDNIYGGNTVPLKKVLSMKHILDEGIVNAIKTTQSIRGIVKTTKGLLKPKDIKNMRDQFVKDFIENDDGYGVGGLDATMDFTPVKLEPTVATDAQIKSIDNKVLSYFGISEKIVQSTYSEDEWNSFYESVLEPISLQMSLEFSNKIFTPYEKHFGNEVVFESNRLQYVSNNTKINLLRYANNIFMVDELREIFNKPPLPDGKGQIIMQDLNHIDSDVANDYQMGKNNEKEGEEDETEEGNQTS